MSKQTLVKIGLLVALAASALVGRHGMSPWMIAGLLAFGVYNALFSTPGTGWVRAYAVLGVVSALLSAGGFVTWLVIIVSILVWPPAFLVTWALADGASGGDADERDAASRRAKGGLAALIAAVALVSAAYRLLVAHNLQQTSALFVGLPALLAIVVVVGVSPKSAIGVAFKAVTVGLLFSLVFLWEGVLCVLMSAPLFYVVAGAIAGGMEMARRRRTGTPTVYSFLIVLAVVPTSLEGVTGFTTLNRVESVAASKIVHAAPSDIERAIFEAPRFERGRPRPLLLRAGFPTPAESRIERRAGTTRWVVRMRGGEMLLNGMEARAGDLVLELESARPGLVAWRAVSDSSHMTHFLTFRESIVHWEQIDSKTTRVTWVLRYDRGLDPAFYFGPMERYAARLAAGYLIDTVATP
jgi:hypothetical protein